MRISDWSSDVCSSDLMAETRHLGRRLGGHLLVEDAVAQPLGSSDVLGAPGQADLEATIGGDTLPPAPRLTGRLYSRRGGEWQLHVHHSTMAIHCDSNMRSEEQPSELQSIMRL